MPTRALQVLDGLFLAAVGTPATVALIALYMAGLISLDERQTQSRVTRHLPGPCHDALNQLMRTVPRSTRAVLAVLIRRTQHRGEVGYLCLGDVVIEVAFATWLRWAGWADAYAKMRQVYGLHLVVLVWCRRDGHWRLPMASQLWGDPFSRHRDSPLVTTGTLPSQWRSNVLATGLQLSCNATIRLTCTVVPQHRAAVARRRPWASGGNGVARASDAAHLPMRLH